MEHVNPLDAERAVALANCADYLAAKELEKRTRPFRFEDLEGKPEPEKWGPCYPKTASAAVEKWRKAARLRDLTEDEARQYGAAVHAWIGSLNAVKPHHGLALASNSASGQPTEFSAAMHRRKLLGELHSAAARDRAAWAISKEIGEAYKAAMEVKRARLEAERTAPKPESPEWHAARAKFWREEVDKRNAELDAARKAVATHERTAPAPIVKPHCPARRTALKAAPMADTEAQRALAWRKAKGLTRAALAEMSGFSASQIQDYEEGARRGKTGAAAEIGEGAWKRYRLACAALQANLKDPW